MFLYQKIILVLISFFFLIQPAECACGNGQEIFGEGTSWNRTFADNALAVFNALSPDPAWEDTLKHLPDNSWINCCLSSPDPTNYLKPWGHNEVPMIHIASINSILLTCG
jgi:hypothetical protein